MSKFDLLEVLQQDMEDLKSIFGSQNNDLNNPLVKNLAGGIISNLEDHIVELIEYY